MLFAGAVCGLSLAWSYDTTTGGRSAARWYGYKASYVVILLALGVVSLIVLEPRYTMAELMVADDPLGDLLPPAAPLLIVGPLVGTAVTWALFGRNRGSILPILVTCSSSGSCSGTISRRSGRSAGYRRSSRSWSSSWR